jgi:hypothetical protein
VNVKALVVAGGIVWGGYLFLAALLEMLGIQFLMWNSQSFKAIQAFYPAISASPFGAVIALIWGFLCAAASIVIFVWLYNALIKKM